MKFIYSKNLVPPDHHKHFRILFLRLTCFLFFFTISNFGLGQSQFEISTTPSGEIAIYLEMAEDSSTVTLNGNEVPIQFQDGRAILPPSSFEEDGLYYLTLGEHSRLIHIRQFKEGAPSIRNIPLWMSLLPPLIAIGLALIFKEVVISLFTGIWAGAFIAGGLRWDAPLYYFESFFATISKYILPALNNPGHLSVIVFSLLIGGMVALISKNGGMAGVVNRLSKYAKSKKSAQLITWFLGVAIFFDDYANTLIVGNTMRPVADKFRVSREKLAYIVDSTAAPIAAVAFITTWIGAELGYIDSGLDMIENWNPEASPYSIFIQSLKFSFYPILTLSFILIMILLGRDFGPMHLAEQKAASPDHENSLKETSNSDQDDELSPVPESKKNMWDAILPIFTVVGGTMAGIAITGMRTTSSIITGGDASLAWGEIWRGMDALRQEAPGWFGKMGIVVGNADSYVALLWGSLAAVLVAIALNQFRGTMKITKSIHWMTQGFKSLMPAIIILTLAWSLAITTEQLQTADFMASILQDQISPYWLPPLIFVLSALIAFSTGSSWSTMAILYPIAIPTTWVVCEASGVPPDLAFNILLNVVANVLAASVLGDHCSPISDTTILSSLATQCNHIDHVQTQMPYALTVGAVSLVCVFLSTLMGGQWYVSFFLGSGALAILWLILRYKGRKLPTS